MCGIVVPGAWSVSEEDPVAVLKQHILDETVEAASGIQFLLEGLRAQWDLAWEALLLADKEVCCRCCRCCGSLSRCCRCCRLYLLSLL